MLADMVRPFLQSKALDPSPLSQPSRADMLCNDGLALHARGRYAEAIASFNQALAIPTPAPEVAQHVVPMAPPDEPANVVMDRSPELGGLPLTSLRPEGAGSQSPGQAERSAAPPWVGGSMNDRSPEGAR